MQEDHPEEIEVDEEVGEEQEVEVLREGEAGSETGEDAVVSVEEDLGGRSIEAEGGAAQAASQEAVVASEVVGVADMRVRMGLYDDLKQGDAVYTNDTPIGHGRSDNQSMSMNWSGSIDTVDVVTCCS